MGLNAMYQRVAPMDAMEPPSLMGAAMFVVSQSWTVPSSLPEARVRPSVAKATDRIVLDWPIRGSPIPCASLGFATSQKRIV